jgi:hypothetical protein
VCRELQQELVQACPLLGLERREELVLHERVRRRLAQAIGRS